MVEYKYDINLGHYYPINEAEEDNNQNTTSGSTTENNLENSEDKAFLTNIDNEEVLKLKQEKQNKISEMQNKLNTKNNLSLQALDKLNKIADSNNLQEMNAAQKQLLQAKKDIADITFEMAKTTHDYDVKILVLQQSLLESIITDSFPSRYKQLNEQIIESSKIYLDTLFNSDGGQIVNEMEDYKKIMGKANLLYGRDNKGYFAVCVDQYDLNKLTTVLEKAGYLKENILGCCFSLIYL